MTQHDLVWWICCSTVQTKLVGHEFAHHDHHVVVVVVVVVEAFF